MKRLEARFSKASDMSIAQLIAHAFPDRIGKRRKGDEARFVLSGGKGAVMDTRPFVANASYIVAIELDGNPSEAKIRQAIEITRSEIRDTFETDLIQHKICNWSKRDQRCSCRCSVQKIGNTSCLTSFGRRARGRHCQSDD